VLPHDLSQNIAALPSDGEAILNALPNPVLLIAPDGKIVDANMAAESFFEISTQFLRRQSLKELVPFGSPLLALIDQVRNRGSPVNEYKVDLSARRAIGGDRQVDLHVAPLPERPGHIVVMLQERTIADKMDRQLTHRSAARSVIALAAMLAHEIKNPLSGIRGAAQLLEQRLVRRPHADAADLRRGRPHRHAGRPHGGVRRRAAGGARPGQHPFGARSRQAARAVRLCPQHPLRRGLRSVAAAGAGQPGPADPGVSQPGEERRRGDRRSRQRRRNPAHHRVPSGRAAVGAGQEIAGVAAARILRQGQRPGVPDDLLPNLFDPFVTTKPTGSGLGLALVAKIVGDHGGIIECESQPRKDHFRVLMPMFNTWFDQSNRDDVPGRRRLPHRTQDEE
jgi:two-component system nitrogen regulation sensor histidine kinase GlnL